MSDLTTRLRAEGAEDRADAMALMTQAAARIEALEAVIAEALADLNTYSENEFREIQHARILRVRAILSRVPQGAAEPSDEIEAQRDRLAGYSTADRIRAGSGMEPEYGEGNRG